MICHSGLFSDKISTLSPSKIPRSFKYVAKLSTCSFTCDQLKETYLSFSFFHKYGRSFRSFAYNLLPVFALIFGTSFVFMHNGFVFGDFLNFFSVQRSWGNNISGLFLLNNFEHAGTVYSYFRQDPFVITRIHFDMFANILLLVSSYKLWRWKYFPETIFSLACFVVNSFKPGLASASRFVIVCLPISITFLSLF